MSRFLCAALVALAFSLPASAQTLRAPTPDEAWAINMGGESYESRMNRVPVFAASVPQDRRVLVGCLELNTRTDRSDIRDVLNRCIFPIQLTATPGFPAGFPDRNHCVAVGKPITISLQPYESRSIGKVVSRPGHDDRWYDHCFAEISDIGVVGRTLFPPNDKAAQSMLASLWSAGDGLLQKSVYEPEHGDESRIVTASKAQGRCATKFAASQVKSQYGAKIRNFPTVINWAIPSQLWPSSHYRAPLKVMSNRITFYPLDRGKYENHPEIWFDDIAKSIKASQAIAVLLNRCRPEDRRSR